MNDLLHGSVAVVRALLAVSAAAPMVWLRALVAVAPVWLAVAAVPAWPLFVRVWPPESGQPANVLRLSSRLRCNANEYEE